MTYEIDMDWLIETVSGSDNSMDFTDWLSSSICWAPISPIGLHRYIALK